MHEIKDELQVQPVKPDKQNSGTAVVTAKQNSLIAPSEGRRAGNTQHPPRKMKSTKFKRAGSDILFALPGMVLLSIMSIYPMYILVKMSISDVTIKNIIGDWSFIGLSNFVAIFASRDFQSVMWQTLVFVVFVLVATMLAGLVAALILRPSKGFSLITQVTLIMIWTLPPVIVGALWKFLFATDGFINAGLGALGMSEPIPFLSQPSTALGAIAIVSIWLGVPFAGLVMKSAILDISEEVLDAARVDGANSWQILSRITLPIIRPTLLILSVLTVVGAFKAFDLIYVMTKGGPGTSSTTLPFLGYTTAFQSFEFGHAAAISVVAMVIVLGLAVAYIFAVSREEK